MNGIRLVHQTNYRKGKSLADMALIVDAMDLFYGGRLDGFCIASSDGDFSPLCMALREKGAAIFGFGLQSTPDAFRATCNKFFLLDMKQSSSKAASKEVSAVSPLSDKLSQLVGVIDAGIAENGGFSLVSQLGSYLHKHVPNFRPKDFGGANLSKLLRMMPGRYVIEGSGEKMRARLIKENLHKQYSISHNIIKIAILIFIISVLFILICKAFLIH